MKSVWFSGRRIYFCLSIVATASTACVSSGEYAEAVASRDSYQAGAEKCRSEYTELESRFSATLQEAADRQNQLVDREAAYRLAVSQKDRTIGELQRQREASEKSLLVYRRLLQELRGLTEAGALKVVIRGGRMIIVLPAHVLFDSGSAVVSGEGRQTLQQVGRVLADVNRDFQVEGHTDSNPILSGPYKSNLELGAARAIHVSQLLIDGGVRPERISAASFGETRPVRSNADGEGRRSNRRIEIVVVPELDAVGELLQAATESDD